MFGRNLRQARGCTPFTQDQLGKHIDVAPGQVGLYERGIHPPRLFRLPALCAILGVSSDQLLGLRNDAYVPADPDERLRLATIRRLQVAPVAVITVVSQVLTLGHRCDR